MGNRFLVPSVVPGGMTLLSTTTLTGASVTLSSIPQTYRDLKIVFRNFLPSTDNAYTLLRVNGDSNANRYNNLGFNGAPGTYTFNSTFWPASEGNDNSAGQGINVIDLYDYTNTTTWKIGQTYRAANNATTTTSINIGRESLFYNQTPAITSLVFSTSAGNFTSGSILLYGVN
jgi:hypothetical protein